MPARSVCLVTLSLSEAGPGRFGRQVSVTDIYHTIPYHTHWSGEGFAMSVRLLHRFKRRQFLHVNSSVVVSVE